MADFQSAFDNNTRGINTTLTTQLSSVQQWANIPGSLMKASSSAAGYLWGYNSSDLVWVCQQPCTGSWSQVSINELSSRASAPSSSIGYLSGPMISGNIPIISKNVDDKGNTVYIASEDVYTKMVNSAGVSKYYTGPVSDYSPSKWPTYADTVVPGSYRFTLGNLPDAPPSSTAVAPKILDITTDDTNVYLLYEADSKVSLATKTANNQTSWTIVSVNSIGLKPSTIFSTHTYIWLQSDTSEKAKIPKPVNMSNVMSNPDTSVRITSSSSTSLYGVDKSGHAMKSDETLQSGWSPISGLSGISVKSLVGDIDQTGLFFIDETSGLSRCVGDCTKKSIAPVNTQGFLPMNVTADPSSKQLWMTSTSTGKAGNIFNRIASPNYMSISKAVAPYDERRDAVVKDIEKDYKKQTEVMTVNKQLSEFQKMFSNLFGQATKSQSQINTEISQLDSTITTDQAKLDKISAIQPSIQRFVVTIAIAALVYAVLTTILGWITHILVLFVIAIGIYLSLNNDIALPSLWA